MTEFAFLISYSMHNRNNSLHIDTLGELKMGALTNSTSHEINLFITEDLNEITDFLLEYSTLLNGADNNIHNILQETKRHGWLTEIKDINRFTTEVLYGENQEHWKQMYSEHKIKISRLKKGILKPVLVEQ